MSAKAIRVLCAQAFLIQSIYGQCIGSIGSPFVAEEYGLAGNGLAYGAGLGLGAPFGYAGQGIANYGLGIAPTSGGGFAVTSSSPIAPTGITVISENAIEGTLAMNGELPFLGAVVIEGALPTVGSGGISYGCGSGAVGIVSEGVAPGAAGYSAGLGYGPAVAGLGYGGIGGRGFGGLEFGLGSRGCNGVY